MRKFLALILLALPISACTTPIVPETANEQLVFIEYQYQGALLSSEAMKDAGTLTGEAAEQVADALEGAGVAVRAAREAIRLGSGNAMALVAAANQAVLKAIQMIEEREKANG